MTARQPLWRDGHRQALAASLRGSDGAELPGPWSPLAVTCAGQLAALPPGWRTYLSPAGRFSFGFPTSWSVAQELEDGVCLRSEPPLAHLLVLVRPFAGAQRLLGPGALGPDTLIASICTQLDRMQTFDVASTGTWHSGPHRGHIVEGLLHDELLQVDAARAYVLVPVSEDEVVFAVYSLHDRPCISPEQYGLIWTVLGSFCLRPGRLLATR